MRVIQKYRQRIDSWPNWYCDEAALHRHIEERLGKHAYVDVDGEYAYGGQAQVADGQATYHLVIFFKRAGNGLGWVSSDRTLVPCEPGQQAGGDQISRPLQ